MAQQAVSGPGAGSTIDINPDELTHIANELIAIADEFESIIKPAVKSLKSNKYLTEGAAKKAMDKVPKANERVLELEDHYNRASTLVFETLESMIQADEAIGQQIISALNIE
ncbi:hypothetical protein [Listeria costaricensis]|uniref:hypothetical protein n=1 Tax=Listeria costaricensis TaxID=2026604 RepID=UPI000C075BB8|nr:hypothetical protein [Listeria costaricensis]